MQLQQLELKIVYTYVFIKRGIILKVRLDKWQRTMCMAGVHVSDCNS